MRGDTTLAAPQEVLTTTGPAVAATPGDATLRVQNLYKRFTATGSVDKDTTVAAVNGVSFEIEAGEFFTLVGPSGCGKTTTLRCIAGLETPDTGRIAIGSRDLFSSDDRINVHANTRQLGMVFQSYAIWPHMTVGENVAFPIKVRSSGQAKVSKKDVRQRVERALSVVQLGHLYDRPATDLSGGQQQRLALARALVTAPPLLLLDEPLSNLDAKLRADMRLELKRLQTELGVTTLYVTHDQTEALALSNVVGVMADGVIQQLGPPKEIYERPRSAFVAGFIGTSNFLGGTVKEPLGNGSYLVSTDLGPLRGYSETAFGHGDSIVVTCRPEHIKIVDSGAAPTSNQLTACVRASAYLGDAVELLTSVNGTDLRVHANPSTEVAEGENVEVVLDPARCLLLEPAG